MKSDIETLRPLMPEIVRILDIFAEGCTMTRHVGKKPWACPECYNDVVARLQSAGVPSRRLAEHLVMAHRYPE
jgi:hypothetical protein